MISIDALLNLYFVRLLSAVLILLVIELNNHPSITRDVAGSGVFFSFGLNTTVRAEITVIKNS